MVMRADICLCGAFDYDNGSVVCWVCEEVVMPWIGSITTATLPGHEATPCHEWDDHWMVQYLGRVPQYEVRYCLKCSAPQRRKLGAKYAHLRDDAPYTVCSDCERKAWGGGNAAGTTCGMPQPDGSTCQGVFGLPIED